MNRLAAMWRRLMGQPRVGSQPPVGSPTDVTAAMRAATVMPDRGRPAARPIDPGPRDPLRVTARETLGDTDFAAVRTIRRMVFHDEQGFIDDHVTDADDPRSIQVIGLIPQSQARGGEPDALFLHDGVAIACGRLTIEAVRQMDASVTWVATLPGYRGEGAGAVVMRRLVQIAGKRGVRSVMLSSQGHAVPFYRHLGFTAIGAPYEIRGMPHQLMLKTLDQP